jgi:hypothetical protein
VLDEPTRQHPEKQLADSAIDRVRLEKLLTASASFPREHPTEPMVVRARPSGGGGAWLAVPVLAALVEVLGARGGSSPGRGSSGSW